MNDEIVKTQVGEVKRLELVYFGENNWHEITYWKIYGNSGTEFFKAILNPKGVLSIKQQAKKVDCGGKSETRIVSRSSTQNC